LSKTIEKSVLEMAKGALIEQFNTEFVKIGSNILDPNTDATKARKITLTLTFKPDENREFIGWEAQANPCTRHADCNKVLFGHR